MKGCLLDVWDAMEHHGGKLVKTESGRVIAVEFPDNQTAKHYQKAVFDNERWIQPLKREHVTTRVPLNSGLLYLIWY